MRESYKEIMQMELPEKYRNDVYQNSKPKKEIDFDDKELIDFL